MPKLKGPPIDLVAILLARARSEPDAVAGLLDAYFCSVIEKGKTSVPAGTRLENRSGCVSSSDVLTTMRRGFSLNSWNDRIAFRCSAVSG